MTHSKFDNTQPLQEDHRLQEG